MKLIQQVNEATNKAAAQGQLNQAVIAGDQAGTKAAYATAVAAVGEKMAAAWLKYAQDSVAEKNARGKATVGVSEAVDFGSKETV